MLKILLQLILLMPILAMAEHDATYCGKLIKPKANDHVALLLIPYNMNIGDWWENEYEDYTSVATIYDVNSGSKAEKNLKYFLKSKTKNKTIICVKGRWGGSLSRSTLSTDSVDRIDYESNFFDY